MNSTGYVIDGVYYKGGIKEPTQITESPTYRNWSHDQQRQNHQRDIIQPHTKDGRPNAEFIQAYPIESKSYFNDQQLKESGV